MNLDNKIAVLQGRVTELSDELSRLKDEAQQAVVTPRVSVVKGRELSNVLNMAGVTADANAVGYVIEIPDSILRM